MLLKSTIIKYTGQYWKYLSTFNRRRSKSIYFSHNQYKSIEQEN